MGFLMLVLLAALPPLSVSAVIDVLLLAFIIYYILQMVKGTQAPQILLGMALLVTLYYGARWGCKRSSLFLERSKVKVRLSQLEGISNLICSTLYVS